METIFKLILMLTMFNKFRFLLFTLFISITAYTQKPFGNLKVVKAAFDSANKASIIPDTVFSANAHLLWLTFPSDTIEHSVKQGYEIRWPSTFIDGSLVLTITKKQVYLRSGHDNPNPNRLYWFVNINEEQYQQIAQKLEKDTVLFERQPSEYMWYQQLWYKKYIPESGIPRKWTDRQVRKHQKDWQKKRYLNLTSLINFINNDTTINKPISFSYMQNDLDRLKGIRIAYSEEDYEGQIKFVPPTVNKD